MKGFFLLLLLLLSFSLILSFYRSGGRRSRGDKASRWKRCRWKEEKKKTKNNLFLVAYLILLLVLLLLLLLRCYVGEYIVALVASSIKPEVETADMSTQQSASSLFLFSVVRFLYFSTKQRHNLFFLLSLHLAQQSWSPYSAPGSHPRSEKQVPFYRWWS